MLCLLCKFIYMPIKNWDCTLRFVVLDITYYIVTNLCADPINFRLSLLELSFHSSNNLLKINIAETHLNWI